MLHALIILGLFLAAFLFSSYYTYTLAFYSSPKRRKNPYILPNTEQYNVFREENTARVAKLLAEKYEPVSTTSFDGLALTGKYYHRQEGAPVVVCFHGWRSTGIRDFCGIASTFLAMNHNVLLVDQRAQGKSEGRSMTFGIKERYDCQTWINYINDRFSSSTDIFLCGLSMGAATVLMASGLELPDNVRCVLADSPYSSPAEIIKKVCRDMKIAPAIAWPFLCVGARLFAGFSLTAATAADAIRRATIPILIMHGTDDRFVPCEMSAEFPSLNPLVERHTFEGAGHGISFLLDQPRYEAIVQDFINRAKS